MPELSEVARSVQLDGWKGIGEAQFSATVQVNHDVTVVTIADWLSRAAIPPS
jgi:hypothetical protein